MPDPAACSAGIQGDVFRRERGRRGILREPYSPKPPPPTTAARAAYDFGEPAECAGPRPQRRHPESARAPPQADRQVAAVASKFLNQSCLANPAGPQTSTTGPNRPVRRRSGCGEDVNIRGPPDESIPRRPTYVVSRPKFSTGVQC